MWNLSLLNRTEEYYPREDYYEKVLARFDNLKEYRFLAKNCGEILTAANRIKLFEKFDFGLSRSRVEKQLGKPRYFYKNRTIGDGLQILLYKHKLGGYKTKTELHFYKDQLFYFNHTLDHLADKDKEVIFEILRLKYFGKGQDIHGYEAVDEYRNKVFVTNELNFAVHYLSGNSALLRELISIAESKDKQERKEAMKRKELLQKL